jgi:predicted O-methyltransferase YrrM
MGVNRPCKFTSKVRELETGVRHGVTARIILDALERNGKAPLWRVDLRPLRRFGRSRSVWQLPIATRKDGSVKGSSRLRLPKLLSQLGPVDFIIHDSMYSERNVCFDLDRVWKILTPGGAIVVDDVEANRGSQSFTQAFACHRSMICEPEPIHPDLWRPNKKGMFGIILQTPAQL